MKKTNSDIEGMVNKYASFKLLAPLGLTACLIIAVNHFCEQHRINAEHRNEMEEEELRHQHMTEILEKFSNLEINPITPNPENEIQ